MGRVPDNPVPPVSSDRPRTSELGPWTTVRSSMRSVVSNPISVGSVPQRQIQARV